MKAVLILATLACLATVSFAATNKIVCYFESWSTYRPGYGKFNIEDIDPSLCSHVIYTFLGLNSDGTIKFLDEWNDINFRGLQRFANLKLHHPSIKVLMAIGGLNEASSTYSAVVNNPTKRSTFVNSIVNIVANYEYDGFDLDWLYPGQRGGSASDRTAFVTLLQELRPHFDQNRWLLTAAVATPQWYLNTSYDVPKMSKYLDMINIMAYEFHSSYDGKTGHNAPLYKTSIDTTAQEKLLNVHSAINAWIDAGAKREKLILGMGAYGRTFTLLDPSNNGLGAPVTGAGARALYTNAVGYMGYNEICEKKMMGGWTKVWDVEQQRPYIYKGDQWICYDDPKSIKLKSQYAVAQQLGGAMIWSIDVDDFRDICGEGKFPLLATINNVFKGVVSTPETTIKPNLITCQVTGFIRDPLNCAIFYSCQQKGNALIPVQYNCGVGLFFDITINMCNYANSVMC